ncbi:hypothetical protein [Paraburkholderia sp. BR14320]|uniref:hypothetical protein n=1 Tax=unclassified Paraburkholderia TaxID=2615204 RepID=UPI0034CFEFA9
MTGAPNSLRDGLPPLPAHMANLPVDGKGFPVPFFVAWIDGKPDFRLADPDKMTTAVRFNRCWICGQPLGKYLAFVSGPMCTINRASAEPPSHLDCATFAATTCPFLVLPKAVRRDAKLPEERADPAGVFVKHNPGVCAIWITKDYGVRRVDDGVLFNMGEPSEVLWYTQGRRASRAEVMTAIEAGLPLLREIAQAEGTSAQLEQAIDVVVSNLLP